MLAFPNNTLRAMPGDDLRDTIKHMMVEKLMLKIPKEEIHNDTPLFGAEGLALDSIDALELVVSLEKQFGVQIVNSEIAKSALVSVNSIHDFVIANRSHPSTDHGVNTP
jgi:acyl carrier protein